VFTQAVKKLLVPALVRQFGNPHGLLGRAVGWSMSRRPSNVRRSRWVVELLDLQPADRVLEVGCGPGVALAAAAQCAGTVVGVDRSPVMVRQARRRAKVTVHEADAEHLPSFDRPFDKAFAVNTVGHWPDPIAGLRSVRAVLRAGGTIAVASQPRCPGATTEHSRAAADQLTRQLREAGFVDPRVEVLDLDPPAVCVLATK
jgi:ubiquinone/menaquinone biosynthesis C-methylase UbiE